MSHPALYIKYPARLVTLCAICLGIFTMYAGSLVLITYLDDPVSMMAIAKRSVISVFDVVPYGTSTYRPLSMVPWIVVRDLAGWFQPTLLHMFNLATHTICTALVGSFAWRMSRCWRIHTNVFPALAALFFGLFPFSYQVVLWPGSLPHPMMMLFGLASLHAYITARRSKTINQRIVFVALSSVLMLAACLAHEEGVVFGFLVLLVESAISRYERSYFRVDAFILTGLMAGYAVFFKLVIQAQWPGVEQSVANLGLPVILQNFAYHAQGMLVWLLIPLRSIIGLPPDRAQLLLVFLSISLSLILILLWRLKQLLFGVTQVLWWIAAISPSVLLLGTGYVGSGPRLMYPGAVGIAVLYAGLVAIMLQLLPSHLLKACLIGGVAVLCIWCIPYITDRQNETALLTYALRPINADLQSSPADSRVLLVNMPAWAGPTNPAFLTGSEGLYYYWDGTVPAWTIVASIANVTRDTQLIRFGPGQIQTNQLLYGLAGKPVDTDSIKTYLFGADYLYRFVYEPSGFHTQRIAIINPYEARSTPLASFSLGSSAVVLESGNAVQCQDHIAADLTWASAGKLQEPLAVFVHGLNAVGEQIVVADRDPMDGLITLNDLPLNTRIQDHRIITTTTTSQAVHTLQLGLYRRSDGQRYKAIRADGTIWEGESVVIPVEHYREPSECSD